MTDLFETFEFKVYICVLVLGFFTPIYRMVEPKYRPFFVLYVSGFAIALYHIYKNYKKNQT